MDVCDRVREAAAGPDGGIEVVSAGAVTPELDRRLRELADELGFLVGMASAAAGDRPPGHGHRHLLIVCADRAAAPIAIAWMREAAFVSPRRHVLVLGHELDALEREIDTSGKESGAVPPPPRESDPAVGRLIQRADGWRRRGRRGSAHRWLVAAACAAARRGDVRQQWAAELAAVREQVDGDRLDEAEIGLRTRLMKAPWPAYAACVALQADVLIARGELAGARAWCRSCFAEAQVRADRPPGAVLIRAAELDFWQGRSPPRSATDSRLLEPEAWGWRLLGEWSRGNLAGVAGIAAAKLAPTGESAPAQRWWWLLSRVLLGASADARDLAGRIDALIACGEAEGVSRRLCRLGALLAGRLWLRRSEAERGVALLRSARGPGPAGTAACLLLESVAPERRAERRGRAAPARLDRGLAFLVSGSTDMHLVDGLSGLLALIEEAADDAAVLDGACRWVRRQSGASAVAIVAAGCPALAAADGWRVGDLGGEIAAILNGPAGDARRADADRNSGSFGVSIRYAGVAIGQVVVRGPAVDRPAMEQAAQAAATLCAPALRARLDALLLAARARDAVPEIVGDSPLMASVREVIGRAATTPFPVVIEGESGTGKELVARALHRLGPRRDRRFSAVNCAALTDDLVEAELFGHTRGAFTGAVGPRAGLFEDAHGGTLFLDEVTELSPRAQAKLLRALQEREVRRVGENVSRPVDVRVITASNVPLHDAVGAGRFRDDLRFRLAVIRIPLPPLRERLEDVPALARLFWRRAADEAGTRAMLGADAVMRLARHGWPGNVRELQNVVSALVVCAPRRGRVSARHVDQVLAASATGGSVPIAPLEAARRTFERRLIAAALVRHAGRRSAAASELGLTRQGLTKALRRLGLRADEDAAGVA